MSRAIAAALRDAANGPTPKDPDYLCSWLKEFSHEYKFARWLRVSNHCYPLLHGMTNAERRMFLLFCSYPAQDEE